MQFSTANIISIIKDSDSAERLALANAIISNDLDLTEYLNILYQEPKIAMRFSWLLGDLASLAGNDLQAVSDYIFEHREEIKIKNFDRSVAKLIFLCGVREPLIGAAVDTLVEWLLDPKISIGTKHFSILAMHKYCKMYPDLSNEFIEVLESSKEFFSPALRKKAEKTILRLA